MCRYLAVSDVQAVLLGSLLDQSDSFHLLIAIVHNVIQLIDYQFLLRNPGLERRQSRLHSCIPPLRLIRRVQITAGCLSLLTAYTTSAYHC